MLGGGFGSLAATARNESRLSVVDIAAGYGGASVFAHASLDVGPGEVAVVLGRNGAGKTTLLNCLCGLVTARSGRITLEQEITTWSPRARVKAGIVQVPEGRRMVAGLTVWENLQLGSFVLPMKRFNSQLETVLDHFPSIRGRLKDDACSLSGGQQQLVAIARALMSAPKVLLLDEPLTGLSPAMAWGVIEVLSKLRTQQQAVLLVEQNAELALKFADEAYILSEGTLAPVPTQDPDSSEEVVQRYFA